MLHTHTITQTISSCGAKNPYKYFPLVFAYLTCFIRARPVYNSWGCNARQPIVCRERTFFSSPNVGFNLECPNGHFTHKTESPWPLLFKHSHWWKRRSWSKFASHYPRGTNGVCECNMDVKSTRIPTWHQMDHVSWSLGPLLKIAS
jgi:hypothetical protein